MFKILSQPPLVDPDSLESNLVDKLLAEQKTLSAVERFSQQHERMQTPAQEPHYKDLIPIRKPSSGEQYSFAVDLDKCTGCKACVVACHSRNGLDDDESWRDVGKIRSSSTNEQQTVTSACHHCADPACLSGCPVGAYEKVEDTGIVRHLDDQCIGCEYCSLKCPYDVPKYNKELGIVRKCDMCHDRLAEGEAPACVQSCPNGAIQIELVSKDDIYLRARQSSTMIAGAFRSDYTFPTTRFTSKREIPQDMAAVDEQSIEASHKHTPLSWMLMLTQVSVGISVMEMLSRLVVPEFGVLVSMPMLGVAILLGMVGLVTSLFHLGSPMGAWRVFLGLKTSWLSREIVMFGLWMPALLGYAALVWAGGNGGSMPDWLPLVSKEMVNTAGLVAVTLGLVSVGCSIMVYVDTKRAFWSLTKTTARFGGSLWVGGTTAVLLVASVMQLSIESWIWWLAWSGWLLKAAVELKSLVPAWAEHWTTQKKSALIQVKTLRTTLLWRWGLLLGCIFLSFFSGGHMGVGVLALLSLLGGEFLERQLFFQAVETLKMPGNLKR